MKKIALTISIIFLVAVVSLFISWKSINNTQIIRVLCYECEDCGCDLDRVWRDETFGKPIINGNFKNVFDCIEKYPKVSGSIEDDYLLTKKEINEVVRCIEK